MSGDRRPPVRAGMRPLGSGAFGVSVGCHAAVLALVFWGPLAREKPVLYEVIRIRVVSPPPASAPVEERAPPPPPEDELVVETPSAAPPEQPAEAVAEEALPEPEPQPEPEPAEPEPPPLEPSETAPPPDSAETPPPEPEPAPADASEEPDAEEGGENINVRQEGMQRDHPEYWDNLIRQMKRCFRPTQQDRAAKVRFVVRRDGSTSGIGIAESSGSFAFDLDAMGAAECIGKAGRLGPLPDDFPWDTVPVEIELSPPGRRGGG